MYNKIAFLCLFLGLWSSVAQAQQAVTLKACVDYALKNHPSNALSQNEIALAKHKATEALAGYLPQVSTNITIDDNLKRQVSIIPAGAFSPTEIRLQFGTQYNNSATAQVDQVLYDKSMLVGIKAAEPNNQLAVLKLEQNQDNLIYNTVAAYFQVLIYTEQEKITLENEKKLTELLNILRLRWEKGVAKKTDYDRAKSNLQNLLSQKSILQMNKKVALNRLKNAIGMPLSEDVAVVEMSNYESLALIEQESSFEAGNVLDYKVLQNNALLQNFEVQRKQAAFLPTVSMYARYGASSFGNELGKSFANWFDFSTVGLKVNIPIFSGYRKTSQLRQAEIGLQNIKTNMKITSDNLNLTFQNSYAQLQKTRSDLSINRENLDFAKGIYESSNLEYQKGVSTLSDLLNAEYSYKEAQTNYITSLINVLSSRLEYEKSKGTLKSYISQF